MNFCQIDGTERPPGEETVDYILGCCEYRCRNLFAVLI